MALQPKAQSRLSLMVAERLKELENVKSQVEISEEIGFTSRNMITIVKNGASKLPLDRVAAASHALNIPFADLMQAALEQYFEPGVINSIREALITDINQTEHMIVNIARENMDTKQPLSHDTRELLADVFKSNKPAGY